MREIVSTTTTNAVDRAVFTGPRSSYILTPVGDALRVRQSGPNLKSQHVSDGVDLVRNVEQLTFSDKTISVIAPAAPTEVTATAGSDSATVTWRPGPDSGGPLTTGYELEVRVDGAPAFTVGGISSTITTRTVLRLTPGVDYTFRVRALNNVGVGDWSAESEPVTPSGAPVAPEAPTGVVAMPRQGAATVTWAPGSDGGSPIVGSEIRVMSGPTQLRVVPVDGTDTSGTVTGLTNGQGYTFSVRSLNVAGAGAWSAASSPVVPSTPPGAPRIGTPVPGPRGGPRTVTATWTAPRVTGGTITGYRVVARRLVNGAVVSTTATRMPGSARSAELILRAGTYVLQVAASNATGEGSLSARSSRVSPR